MALMSTPRLVRDDDAQREQMRALAADVAAERYAPRAAECGASTYISKSKFEPDRLAAAWEGAKKH